MLETEEEKSEPLSIVKPEQPNSNHSGARPSMEGERPRKMLAAPTGKAISGSLVNRYTLEEIVRLLTDPDGGEYPDGVSPKQLLEYIESNIDEPQRPNRSKNHLQVLISRSVERGNLIRVRPSVYTTREFYERMRNPSGSPKSTTSTSSSSISNDKAPELDLMGSARNKRKSTADEDRPKRKVSSGN